MNTPTHNTHTQETIRAEFSSCLSRMFDNLLNGNIADAKKQAKRVSIFSIYSYAIEALGYSCARANTTAYFLKGHTTWEHFCKCEQENAGFVGPTRIVASGVPLISSRY